MLAASRCLRNPLPPTFFPFSRKLALCFALLCATLLWFTPLCFALPFSHTHSVSQSSKLSQSEQITLTSQSSGLTHRRAGCSMTLTTFACDILSLIPRTPSSIYSRSAATFFQKSSITRIVRFKIHKQQKSFCTVYLSLFNLV